MVRKTLEDLVKEDKAFLTPADICGVLQCDPHWIRVAARERPDLIGFPVTIIGSRTKIPRIPFLKFFGAI